MASNPSLVIRIAASLTELKKNLQEGKDQIEVTASSMQKLAAGLSGDKLIQSAHNIVGAVTQIGGATKLTEAEKARLNVTLQKAIDKYEVMGKEAPKAMVELEQATRRVEEPTNQVTMKMVALGAAIGTALGNLAYDMVRRVGSALGDLVAEGLRMSSTVASFDRLTASIGTTADAMLTATRGATKGLISDLDIMQASNKAILLGLPVTAQEMATLAAAAVTLGKAMGQDAKKSVDDLITALGRSSPMILDNLGLTVKVGEANEKYAAVLGKTSSQLTDAEKKMAFYRAAMEAAETKVAALGGVQLTLIDQGTRVATAFTNNAHAVGGFVETALTPFVAVLSQIPQPVISAVVAITTLVAVVAAAKLALVALPAVFASGTAAAGAMAVGTAALTGAVSLLTGALSFLVMTPIGLVITAVVALTAGLLYLRNETKDNTEELYKLTPRLEAAGASASAAGVQMSEAAKHAKEMADNIKELGTHAEREARMLASLVNEGIKPLSISASEAKRIEDELTASVTKQIAETERAEKAMAQLTQAQINHINAIRDKLFSIDDIKRATDYAEAIGRVENVSAMNAATQAEVAKVMEAGVEAMVLAGRATDDLTSTFTAFGLAATQSAREAASAYDLMRVKAEEASVAAAQAAAWQAQGAALAASIQGSGSGVWTSDMAIPSGGNVWTSDMPSPTANVWSSPNGMIEHNSLSGIRPRATGGPVDSLMPYLVGERGPELFVPRSSGTVVPNGAGGSVVVNLHVGHFIGSDQSAARQLTAMVKKELEHSMGSRRKLDAV